MANITHLQSPFPTAVHDIGWPTPVLVLMSNYAVTIFAAAFTSKTSLIRPALVPIHLLINYAMMHTAPAMGPVLGIIGIASASVGSLTLTSEYISRILIKQWAYDPATDGAKARAAGRSDTWDRLRLGFRLAASPRQVNVPRMREAKNTPRFEEGGWVPSRVALFAHNALCLVVVYLVADFIASQPPLPDAAEVFADGRIPLFRRLLGGQAVTVEEVLMRLPMNFAFWLISYCMICIEGRLCALVGLGLFGCEIDDYRPIFGPWSGANSVRNFWGVFWHQMLRDTMTTNVDWLVHSFLRIPKGSGGVVVRYAKIGLVFFHSGILHYGPSFVRPDLFHEPYVVQFFVTQTLGIIIEDAVQALAGANNPPRSKLEARLRNTVGYVWTFVFLSWSLPVWFFTAARADILDRTLPFSVIGLLGLK